MPPITPTSPDVQMPKWVDPTHWAQLTTADSVRTYTPGSGMPLHVRSTIEGLIRPACRANNARVQEVVETALRDDILFTEAWLRLRAEWYVRERLLHIEFTTDDGDEVALNERRDGNFTLSVTAHDRDDDDIGHATITLPAQKVYELAAAVSDHVSPVPRDETS